MLKSWMVPMVVCGVLAALPPARASQFVVLEATGTIAGSLAPGAVIDDAALDVPAHDRLTVMGADGQAVEIDGPHKGPIGEAAHADNGMLTKISEAMQARPAAFGAARGMGFPPPVEPVKEDPWSVDATVGGTVCFFEGRKAILWKPPSSDAVPVSIRDETTNKGAAFDWPANQAAAPWPAALAITDGDRYSLTVGDKHRVVTLRTVEPANSVGKASIIAANAGCATQANALIKAIKPARVVAPS